MSDRLLGVGKSFRWIVELIRFPSTIVQPKLSNLNLWESRTIICTLLSLIFYVQFRAWSRWCFAVPVVTSLNITKILLCFILNLPFILCRSAHFLFLLLHYLQLLHTLLGHLMNLPNHRQQPSFTTTTELTEVHTWHYHVALANMIWWLNVMCVESNGFLLVTVESETIS